jgi:hypothetical protein
MGDDLRQLRGRDAVLQRPVELSGHVGRLVAGNQRCDGDDASVAGREIRALPDLAI